MEKNFELVEKLVNTFGVSYEKAKEALEASNWDAVDAAIYLEKDKNNASQEQPQENVNRNPKGSFNIPVDEMKEAGANFFKSCWDFLSLNTFVVKKSSGEVFLDIPIWLAVLLLCAFFWPVALIMGLVFIMGYRFSFSGPQLGKKKVKNTVNQVENAAEEFVEKVKNAVGPDECEKVDEQPEVVVESSASEENNEENKPE
ncbi:MAG: hypothetical protein IJI57_06680 [Flexilinea sp.]|nr:hypothetical protein [Flexilinea sp.]